MTLEERYESETGEKATYRMHSADYHTIRYVRWLESALAARDRDVARLERVREALRALHDAVIAANFQDLEKIPEYLRVRLGRAKQALGGEGENA